MTHHLTQAVDLDAAAEAAVTVADCDYCGHIRPLVVEGRWCGDRCADLDRGSEWSWIRTARKRVAA